MASVEGVDEVRRERLELLPAVDGGGSSRDAEAQVLEARPDALGAGLSVRLRNWHAEGGGPYQGGSELREDFVAGLCCFRLERLRLGRLGICLGLLDALQLLGRDRAAYPPPPFAQPILDVVGAAEHARQGLEDLGGDVRREEARIVAAL